MAVYKETLPDQLLKLFRENEGVVFNGPELTRRLFPKWAYGHIKPNAFHSPKSISRRLQELAEVKAGCPPPPLKVSEVKGVAHYTLADHAKPKKEIVETIFKDGIPYAKISYV